MVKKSYWSGDLDTMEFDKSAKDCYQSLQCSLLAEMKFVFLIALVFMIVSHAGIDSRLLSQDNKFESWIFFTVFMTSSSNLHSFSVTIVAAYDPLDPNGNITIKWDVMSWTADGYVVSIISL